MKKNKALCLVFAMFTAALLFWACGNGTSIDIEGSEYKKEIDEKTGNVETAIENKTMPEASSSSGEPIESSSSKEEEPSSSSDKEVSSSSGVAKPSSSSGSKPSSSSGSKPSSSSGSKPSSSSGSKPSSSSGSKPSSSSGSKPSSSSVVVVPSSSSVARPSSSSVVVVPSSSSVGGGGVKAERGVDVSITGNTILEYSIPTSEWQYNDAVVACQASYDSSCDVNIEPSSGTAISFPGLLNYKDGKIGKPTSENFTVSISISGTCKDLKCKINN